MKFQTHLYRHTFTSPLGPMTVAAHDTALVGVWFDGQQHQPGFDTWTPADAHPILREASAQLLAYFAGQRLTFDLPLDFQAGTPFQQAVWQALCGIPRGTTVSYGTISERIDRPTAVRAVGAAIGRNPLGIVVPCHRVVGANGSMTGYAGGLDRKIALLTLEGSLCL